MVKKNIAAYAIGAAVLVGIVVTIVVLTNKNKTGAPPAAPTVDSPDNTTDNNTTVPDNTLGNTPDNTPDNTPGNTTVPNTTSSCTLKAPDPPPDNPFLYKPTPNNKVGLLIGATAKADFCGARVATIREVQFNYGSTSDGKESLRQGVANNAGPGSPCALIGLNRAGNGIRVLAPIATSVSQYGYGKCNGDDIIDFAVNIAPTIGNAAATSAVWVVVPSDWNPRRSSVKLVGATVMNNRSAWRYLS